MTPRAFAPASVTAVFAPPDPEAPDSRSRGASLALADGVTVAVAPADETRVTVDGDPVAFEPVERVLDRLDCPGSVDVRPDVPLGRGFGASGAATLATALAADAEFELERARDELVRAAHEAEVAAGTGLGDVFVQDVGGLVRSTPGGSVRTEPGATVGYESYGDIATAEVLGDADRTARIREHGTRALDRLTGDSLEELFAVGWEFARASGLATDRVTTTVERVVDAGGQATMAMVGETVVGVGADLEREARVATDGAHLID